MIKIENTSVVGWEAAIRGMRNPMNSWNQSDSYGAWIEYDGMIVGTDWEDVTLGEKDRALMNKLVAAGTDHRKFMRMIIVTFDLTAPLYWWKEFDTYKVGTVANSCSTMHKIHAKEFTLDDFSYEHLIPEGVAVLVDVIDALNDCQDVYVNYDKYKAEGKLTDDCAKELAWWQMIQLLPTSYNQKRTILLNYEVLANIYKSRRNHRLDEWHDLCRWIETLPYSELITGKGDGID